MMLSRRFEDTEGTGGMDAGAAGAARVGAGGLGGAWGEVGMLVPLMDFLNHRHTEEGCVLSVDGDSVVLVNPTPKFRGCVRACVRVCVRHPC